MAFLWRTDGGPLYVVFGGSTLSPQKSTQKKNKLLELDILWQKNLDPRMVRGFWQRFIIIIIINIIIIIINIIIIIWLSTIFTSLWPCEPLYPAFLRSLIVICDFPALRWVGPDPLFPLSIRQCIEAAW